MPFLSAAILAQVLTVGVGDRLEGRALSSTTDKRFEAEDAAYVSAGLDLDWLDARATYSPSLLLSPIEEETRVFALTHTVKGTADSSVVLYETQRFVAAIHAGIAYTQEDFRRQLFGAPLDPTNAVPPTPVDPTTPISDLSPSDAVQINGLTMRTGTAIAGVDFVERLSRRNTFTEYAAYGVTSGFDDVSRDYYPLTHGPAAGAAFAHGLTLRDTLKTSVDGRLSIEPETPERAWIVSASESYTHLFSRVVTGDAQAGAAYTDSKQGEQEPIRTVYPTVGLGLTYNDLVAQGRLSLRLQLSYAPVLDRSSVTFDPRIGSLVNVSFTRKRLSLYANVSSAVPTRPESIGSLSTFDGNLGLTYDLGAGFAADAGWRTAWQRYGGTQTLDWTWVGFIAVSWSYDLL